MSANVADILREAGFVPAVPATGDKPGTLKPKRGAIVPAVPAVPAGKYKGAMESAKPDTGHPGPAPDTGAIRAQLLELAGAAFMDVAPVRALSDSFLRDCHGMADDALRGLLSMLRHDAERRAGRVPEGDTARVLCQSCGPVWVHPSIAAVLPVVDGWPRALGCPWCFIRKAGLYVPRPSVACATCMHWHPDAINPEGGRGQCACGSFWPAQRHGCGQYRPAGSVVS